MRTYFLLLLMAGGPAFGQLQNNTFTITATRRVNLQPDQLVFNVAVLTPPTAGIDDALAKIPGTGITEADLTEVSTYTASFLQWNFTLAVPFSQISATTSTLTKLEQQTSQRNASSLVSFYVQGTQVSQALQASQPCSRANLIADAKAQAQKLATAAGYSVGPVLAVSDGSIGAPAFGQVYAAVLVSGAYYVATPPPPVTCTAVVKFQLYQYH